VAGVVTNGTIRELREAGPAVFGSFFDVNNTVARELVSRGFLGVLFPPGGVSTLPPFAQELGPKFFASFPGAPAPFPFVSTPDSLLSYNDNPLRDPRITAKSLQVPYLILHTEGDQSTLLVWSENLFAELLANGNDVQYFPQAYTSRGYDPGDFGGTNAHQIANPRARDEAAAEIGRWLAERVPGSQDRAAGLNRAAIDALPDFVGLTPTPSVPEDPTAQ
jgi:hypothetical protein